MKFTTALMEAYDFTTLRWSTVEKIETNTVTRLRLMLPQQGYVEPKSAEVRRYHTKKKDEDGDDTLLDWFIVHAPTPLDLWDNRVSITGVMQGITGVRRDGKGPISGDKYSAHDEDEGQPLVLVRWTLW